MTHGDIWIPLGNKMLYCEAWSDGYIDGVGFGALCSSKKIPTISKLSEIFYGSPFFYEPSTDSYIAKEGDYISEGYGDDIDDEELVADAEKTLELVLDGDLEAAYATDFAKIPLKKRQKIGIGMNAYVKNAQNAWEDFTNGFSQLSVQESCELVVQQYLKDKNFNINHAIYYIYFWKDNQFLIQFEIDKKIYIMPLMIACAFGCGEKTVYGDIGYLKDMTEPDKATLIILRDTLIKHDMPLDMLFGGIAHDVIVNLA